VFFSHCGLHLLIPSIPNELLDNNHNFTSCLNCNTICYKSNIYLLGRIQKQSERFYKVFSFNIARKFGHAAKEIFWYFGGFICVAVIICCSIWSTGISFFSFAKCSTASSMPSLILSKACSIVSPYRRLTRLHTFPAR